MFLVNESDIENSVIECQNIKKIQFYVDVFMPILHLRPTFFLTDS